jgi:hypothetical protein
MSDEVLVYSKPATGGNDKRPEKDNVPVINIFISQGLTNITSLLKRVGRFLFEFYGEVTGTY